MSGTELLREVMKLHPEARKVLLTAYADTDVAIAGINEIALDHYLMKPWDPPEQRLYPVLDDLLGEWRSRVRPAFDGNPLARIAVVAAVVRDQGVPLRQPRAV